MKKGEIIENLKIESMAAEGRCVARHDGRVVFVEGVAPGDVVHVRVYRVKRNYAEAALVKLVEPAAIRTAPFCRHFGFCGGCVWQHISYEVQLQYKQQQVIDSLERIAGVSLPGIRPIIGSAAIRHYRNRLDFTATHRRWLSAEEFRQMDGKTEITPGPGLGFHVPKRFDQVFDVEHCWLMPEPCNAIRLAVKEIALQHGIPFFDLRNQTGYLRTVTVRTTTTGEVMVIIQVAHHHQEWLSLLMNGLAERFPQITSLIFGVNTKRNNTFLDVELRLWKGSPWITEVMNRPEGGGQLQFRISPRSFYQTNPKQAETLYKTAWQMSALTGNELVYDLYTGTGTIACYVASGARRVVGLEYVEEAVEDARVNARLNNINHAEFYSGDIKDLLSQAFTEQHGNPDVVITDPPRTGMHPDVCGMLLRVAPKRIVYVSCNPATQARDIKMLSESYRVSAVQPVDMFPHTAHVENVVCLEKRSTQP
ncbi:MAG: 23S rRNA (uracil-5-)-methyltransferase RumA [Cyclobacteriaceae bacterium]|nr:MAG: 23S rRNA (uracil-5-)-methyltransferase RumA [Cyclobacteriaceae bacterium]